MGEGDRISCMIIPGARLRDTQRHTYGPWNIGYVVKKRNELCVQKALKWRPRCDMLVRQRCCCARPVLSNEIRRHAPSVPICTPLQYAKPDDDDDDDGYPLSQGPRNEENKKDRDAKHTASPCPSLFAWSRSTENIPIIRVHRACCNGSRP